MSEWATSENKLKQLLNVQYHNKLTSREALLYPFVKYPY